MSDHTSRPAEEDPRSSDEDVLPTTRDLNETRDDTAYSPGSEQEVRSAQATPGDLPDGVDADAVNSKPGAGGPDDAGDVDIENTELHLPWREPADGAGA